MTTKLLNPRHRDLDLPFQRLRRTAATQVSLALWMLETEEAKDSLDREILRHPLDHADCIKGMWALRAEMLTKLAQAEVLLQRLAMESGEVYE